MNAVVPVIAIVTFPDAAVFAIAAVIVLGGALGVVLMRNPVHGALSLVATLFGIAVLFVEEQADFLAAVQVIVYAGAIVVLFLFVIMLLGVDRNDRIGRDPLPAQRGLAIILGAAILAGILILARVRWATGAHSVTGPVHNTGNPNVTLLANSIFTTYLLPFEATAALLVIAVVSAVMLARRRNYSADRITGAVAGPESGSGTGPGGSSGGDDGDVFDSVDRTRSGGDEGEPGDEEFSEGQMAVAVPAIGLELSDIDDEGDAP